MLTKLTIRNFKRFGVAEIELGAAVVLVGPNNSGKTTTLQALSLWQVGIKKLAERFGEKESPEKRPGVAINRRDLVALPLPTATMLWKDAHAMVKAERIRIEIIVEGIEDGRTWVCGLEFDYGNAESITCRPLRIEEKKYPGRMPIPAEARRVNVAFLPPMSGLMANETRLEPGAVAVRIGEGRTAEVLRNLCYQVRYEKQPDSWNGIKARLKDFFGVTLHDPVHVQERGEIEMTYQDVNGVELDLAASGRGLQQTLLLMAYLYARPGSVLLLDEPDAHLEILRQRQIYQLLTQTAQDQGSQLIAASHSEVLLNEAADRDIVVAFVGRPHRIDGRASQVTKSLREIGFDHYYQAEQRGWVLYLEGSTDLAILQVFAKLLNHPAKELLDRPFVHYIGNVISKAREHFYGLREAKTDLIAIAILDRDERRVESAAETHFVEVRWKRREIENYLASPRVLYEYARQTGLADNKTGPLFALGEGAQREEIMRDIVEDMVPPRALRDPSDRWWQVTKISDDFLGPLFETYFEKLKLPNLMRKGNYHELAAFVPAADIDPEVGAVLDQIVAMARRARPLSDPNTEVV